MGNKVSTKELGLVLGAKLLNVEDLHYGLWGKDLELRLGNLPEAQQRYTDFLLGHIPKGVKTVLDVGCGTGHVSRILLEKGYQVQAISPSPELSKLVRGRLGPEFPLHETTLEGFGTDSRFDLILFSESYQYIPLENSFAQARALLNPGGHVLICDFFRTDAPGKSPIRGGHDWRKFQDALAAQPFEVVSDEDITALTAPNMDLVDNLLRDYAVPVWEAGAYYMKANRPWLARLLSWVFRKRIDRLQHKYFSHQRTGEAFARFKTYHCILLKLKG
ncbi:MAG: methyltransferase domain-containing protein [Deltaproteobacteria bacterium]|nr:methyltransferase domain-containing protein [Deltaproteobacteria bacterium]